MKKKRAIFIAPAAVHVGIFNRICEPAHGHISHVRVVQDDYVIYQLENFPGRMTPILLTMGENGSYGLVGFLSQKLPLIKAARFGQIFDPGGIEG